MFKIMKYTHIYVYIMIMIVLVKKKIVFHMIQVLINLCNINERCEMIDECVCIPNAKLFDK